MFLFIMKIIISLLVQSKSNKSCYFICAVIYYGARGAILVHIEIGLCPAVYCCCGGGSDGPNEFTFNNLSVETFIILHVTFSRRIKIQLNSNRENYPKYKTELMII